MLALSLALPAVRRVGPALDLMFSSLALDSRISFTRASTATYRDNTGTRQTAAINTPRFDYSAAGVFLGLLVEQQRTNLLLNSATLSTQDVTVTAAVHTLTFEGTGTVTLSGTSTAGPLVGTGATDRVTLSFTPTAGTLTLTVSGTVTAAQLEVGAKGTSWIPTTGTSATRSADVPTITGTNFSAFYGSGNGTWYAEAIASGNDNNRRIVGLTGVPTPLFLQGLSGGTYDGSSAIASGNAATVGVAFKIASTWAANTGRVCLNGGTVASGAQASGFAGNTSLLIGHGDSLPLNGWIRTIRYYRESMTSAQLQALTT